MFRIPLFTRRTREPSTRLRLLARAFQFYGVYIAAMALGVFIALPFFKDHAHTPRWLFTPFYSYIAVTAASYFLIGRALLRRQRWGAYLAGLTIGVPFVRQLIKPDANILSISELGLCTIALCVTVTVWSELGTTRDADFDEDDDLELPTRNRGFGEPRSLSGEAAPISVIADPAPKITTVPGL